jgi:hypothetical protein
MQIAIDIGTKVVTAVSGKDNELFKFEHGLGTSIQNIDDLDSLSTSDGYKKFIRKLSTEIKKLNHEKKFGKDRLVELRVEATGSFQDFNEKYPGKFSEMVYADLKKKTGLAIYPLVAKKTKHLDSQTLFASQIKQAVLSNRSLTIEKYSRITSPTIVVIRSKIISLISVDGTLCEFNLGEDPSERIFNLQVNNPKLVINKQSNELSENDPSINELQRLSSKYREEINSTLSYEGLGHNLDLFLRNANLIFMGKGIRGIFTLNGKYKSICEIKELKDIQSLFSSIYKDLKNHKNQSVHLRALKCLAFMHAIFSASKEREKEKEKAEADYESITPTKQTIYLSDAKASWGLLKHFGDISLENSPESIRQIYIFLDTLGIKSNLILQKNESYDHFIARLLVNAEIQYYANNDSKVSLLDAFLANNYKGISKNFLKKVTENYNKIWDEIENS